MIITHTWTKIVHTHNIRVQIIKNKMCNKSSTSANCCCPIIPDVCLKSSLQQHHSRLYLFIHSHTFIRFRWVKGLPGEKQTLTYLKQNWILFQIFALSLDSSLLAVTHCATVPTGHGNKLPSLHAQGKTVVCLLVCGCESVQCLFV